MSFLRMQESPSSATLWDSCIRRNDRNEAFETASTKTQVLIPLFQRGLGGLNYLVIFTPLNE
ncbi:MAG: hypothetical protein NT007_04180 [Candidatus Kapabacteria bacterium]|nr:hypothetical protein [Candidatus Kapabacteria bacterium]